MSSRRMSRSDGELPIDLRESDSIMSAGSLEVERPPRAFIKLSLPNPRPTTRFASQIRRPAGLPVSRLSLTPVAQPRR